MNMRDSLEYIAAINTNTDKEYDQVICEVMEYMDLERKQYQMSKISKKCLYMWEAEMSKK